VSLTARPCSSRTRLFSPFSLGRWSATKTAARAPCRPNSRGLGTRAASMLHRERIAPLVGRRLMSLTAPERETVRPSQTPMRWRWSPR
jgi:hypothetical protein